MTRGRALALLTLLAASCDGPHRASWTAPLAALDAVPLSVLARSPRDVFAVGGSLGSGGDALFLRYDGAAWQRIRVGTSATLWWVGDVGSALYLVGEQGTILRYASGALAAEASPTGETLFGVWGTSDEDVWAVGGRPDVDGVLLHKDAAGWRAVAPPNNSGAFFKVWGSGPDDVFVVGQGGTILHYDGAVFTAQPSGLAADRALFTVAGRGPGDVYAVGGAGVGVALHYDGAAWSPLPEVAALAVPGLAGVSVANSGALALVGGAGTILRRSGAAAALEDDSGLATTLDLHGVAVVGAEIFAVGGNYNDPAGHARVGVVAHYGGTISGVIR